MLHSLIRFSSMTEQVDPQQTRVSSVMTELEAAFPLQQDADDDDEGDGQGERSDRDGSDVPTRRPVRGRRAAPMPKPISSVSSRRKPSAPQESPLRTAPRKKSLQTV